MKFLANLTNRLVATALLLVCVMAATSCSDDPKDLINYVPKDTSFVVTFQPKELAEKGEFSEMLKDMQARTAADIFAVNFLKDCADGESGINMEEMVVFEHDGVNYLSFIIDDMDKFEKLDLISKNYTKEKSNGVTVFLGSNATIVVDGSTAWMAFTYDNEEAESAVKTFKSQKQDDAVASLSDFDKNMTSADVNAFVNLEQIIGGSFSSQMLNKALSSYGLSSTDINAKDVLNSHVFASLTFGADKASLSVKCLDKKGNDVLSKLFGGLKIDSSILSYYDKSTTAVLAIVMPDFLKTLLSGIAAGAFKYDEVQQGVVNELIKNIDDNVAIGMSFDGDLMTTMTTGWGEKTTAFNQNCINMCFAVKCKKDLSKDVAQLASVAGVSTQNGAVVIPVSADKTSYIKANGKYLIISTSNAAPGNKLTDPGLFAGKGIAAMVNLSASSALSKKIKDAFGVDIDLTMTLSSDKNATTLELKAGNNPHKNVLAYILDTINKIGKAAQAGQPVQIVQPSQLGQSNQLGQ